MDFVSGESRIEVHTYFYELAVWILDELLV